MLNRAWPLRIWVSLHALRRPGSLPLSRTALLARSALFLARRPSPKHTASRSTALTLSWLRATKRPATCLPLRRPVSPTSRSLSICPRLRPRPKQTPRLFSHPSAATIRCSRRPLPHRSPMTPPRTGPNSHPTRPPLRRLRSLPQLRKASARPGPRRAVLSRRHRRRRPAAGAAPIR